MNSRLHTKLSRNHPTWMGPNVGPFYKNPPDTRVALVQVLGAELLVVTCGLHHCILENTEHSRSILRGDSTRPTAAPYEKGGLESSSASSPRGALTAPRRRRRGRVLSFRVITTASISLNFG